MKINQDIIMRLVATFRIVPSGWLNATFTDPLFKANINSMVTNCKVSNNLHFVKDKITGNFLSLTKKGYNNFESKYPIFWTFEPHYDNPSSNRSTSITSKRHTYLFFNFVFKYLVENPQPSVILTDYDEECNLVVKNYSDQHLILPDGMIRHSNADKHTNLLCFEGDTGSEKVKILFEKIFNYINFCIQNFNGEDITSVDLYFCFRTKQRAEIVFKKDNGLMWSNFDQGSSIRYEDSAKKINLALTTNDLINCLKNRKFRLFVGDQDCMIEQYKEIDILSSIIDNCPNTKKQIERILSGEFTTPDNIQIPTKNQQEEEKSFEF